MRQFAIFLFGGGTGALINLAVTYFLTEASGLRYIIAYFIGIILNILFNFFYHRAVTFGVRDNIHQRMARFFPVSIFIGGSILLLIYFFTEKLAIWYIYSGIMAIVIMSVINFFINKFWVFFQYAEAPKNQ